MLHLLQTLTPEQQATLAALFAGVSVSLIHSLLFKSVLFRVKEFSDSHKAAINITTSLVLPLLVTIANLLYHNSSFTHLFPVYGEVYLTSQAWYFTVAKAVKVVRSWYEAYVVLNATPVPPESSF